MAGDPVLHERFLAAADAALAAYAELLEGLEDRFADAPNAPLRRKQARQAARAVLPDALETHLVVTGNYRAWRHFVGMRGSESADPWRSGRWRWPASARCRRSPATSSTTSGSAPWRTAPRSRPARYVDEG